MYAVAHLIDTAIAHPESVNGDRLEGFEWVVVDADELAVAIVQDEATAERIARALNGA